ncbi:MULTISPECIES: tripartite tricarboxylate transporter permease [unclassified Chelatococcus]|uniref:tripartite tricarboxylate transporter permease n=1 Tax=unclassified Chelatococcus TaxID=2638111 RepID=UPI001BCF42A1|nr:tripartite tricarboxylate transporter permease [Chelatococcus sp.]MBS7700005.1 tripartite tricarboxylate transporter permease [Chelatococcus sp. YT9]MBX3558570.1 tripartite tricarboxylate transporter permease [Chelatococcus sp.]
MELFSNLALGFSEAFQPINLMFCFIGVLLGTVIGILPGIGPLATISMLLPLTFGMEPTTSLIMLAGIYYGSQYGGSTTAILVNLPGEAASTVTTLDGYKMALQGRAGVALAAAGLGSFFAGCVATVLIALVAKPLTAVALSFGPPEYFSLMVIGLVSSIALASGSLLKALGMIVFGLLLGLTGLDVYTNRQRFTFGSVDLLDGLSFVAIAVGVFGIAEIIRNLQSNDGAPPKLAAVGRIWPRLDDLRRMIAPTLRGTAIGSAIGVLPGGGAMLSSFIAYNVEKRVSPNSAEFGRGAVEGVTAPEAANNAAAQTSFIPTLTLGIPGSATMAMMIGAMTIQGVTPGPNVITGNPALFWGLIASMWIGNAMLIILNLPLIGLWVSLLKVPYRILFPAIIAFSCIGVYSVSNSVFSVYFLIGAGLVGYFLSKLDCEWAPFVLGFVLGPMLEHQLRRSMLISGGDPSVFVTRPISAVLLLLAVGLLVLVSLPSANKRREEVFTEEV